MMPESTETSLPVYSSIHDADQFKLVTLSIEWTEDKNPWIKRTPYTLLKLYQNWRESRKPEREPGGDIFLLSSLILMFAEDHQRQLLKRIIQPSTRNIRLAIKTTIEYLQQSILKSRCDEVFPYSEFPRATLKEKETALIKLMCDEKYPRSKFPHMTLMEKKALLRKDTENELNQVVDEVFAETKLRLGFPEVTPYEYSYKITSQVVAATRDDQCIKYLKQQRTLEIISTSALARICETLRKDHNTDAEAVIKALERTRSRDHIAAFSISTEHGQTYVSIVNEQSRFVKMESWKFLPLIETAGKPRRLHEFIKKRMNEPVDPFEFGNNKEGEVFAIFDSQEGTLDVICKDTEKKNELRDRATFFVDATDVLCIYTTLKRLEDDRERFNRMKKNATTSIPQDNPFAGLPKAFSCESIS